MYVKDFVNKLNMDCNPIQDMHENSKSHVHASSNEYNVKLTFVDFNVFGAKVYCDPKNRYLIKVEDHPTPMYTSLWVKYQGDHYRGRDRVSYLFIDNPGVVNRLGQIVPREEHCTHRVDSRPVHQPNDKVINSIITKRILIDDDHRALYMRNDTGSEFFYHMKNPLKHSLTTKKVLYVIFNRAERFPKSITFVDTFGQE